MARPSRTEQLRRHWATLERSELLDALVRRVRWRWRFLAIGLCARIKAWAGIVGDWNERRNCLNTSGLWRTTSDGKNIRRLRRLHRLLMVPSSEFQVSSS